MNRNDIASSFGWPFLVTLVGVGPVALIGSCDDVTSCAAKGYVVGPLLLVAVVVTEFVAGRVSASSVIGLVAVLVAVGLVASVIVIGGLWYQSPEPEGPIARLIAVLAVTGLALVLTLPGFLLGRSMHNNAQIARLVDQLETGLISSEQYRRSMAALGHSMQDRAPPGYRCGQCGNPVSPFWHGTCRHCGASYAVHPPVPGNAPPEQ